MDASDKKILGLLQINATLSLAEISRRVGLSKTRPHSGHAPAGPG